MSGLSAEIGQKVADLATGARATPFIVLLAAWSALLSRYAATRDVVVGTTSDGRRVPEVEPIVGFFVKNLLAPADGALDWLFDVRGARGAGARDRPGRVRAPGRSVREGGERLAPERNQSATPLIQVMFSRPPRRRASARGRARRALCRRVPSTGRRHVGARFRAHPRDAARRWVRRRARLRHGALRRVDDCAHGDPLRAPASSGARGPGRPISEVSLLDDAERSWMVEQWRNAPAAASPDALRRLEEQVEHAPDRVAIEHGALHLTYAEVAVRARAVAERLRALGAGAETRVALLVPRSPELVVGLLGVLEVGAVYVPLDPAVPSARLAFVLRDSSARVVLTTRGLAERAGAGAARLSASRRSNGEPPAHARALSALPEQAAYLIYTSGFNGRPQGGRLHASGPDRARVGDRGALRSRGWATPCSSSRAPRSMWRLRRLSRRWSQAVGSSSGKTEAPSLRSRSCVHSSSAAR